MKIMLSVFRRCNQNAGVVDWRANNIHITIIEQTERFIGYLMSPDPTFELLEYRTACTLYRFFNYDTVARLREYSGLIRTSESRGKDLAIPSASGPCIVPRHELRVVWRGG